MIVTDTSNVTRHPPHRLVPTRELPCEHSNRSSIHVRAQLIFVSPYYVAWLITRFGFVLSISLISLCGGEDEEEPAAHRANQQQDALHHLLRLLGVPPEEAAGDPVIRRRMSAWTRSTNPIRYRSSMGTSIPMPDLKTARRGRGQ